MHVLLCFHCTCIQKTQFCAHVKFIRLRLWTSRIVDQPISLFPPAGPLLQRWWTTSAGFYRISRHGRGGKVVARPVFVTPRSTSEPVTEPLTVSSPYFFFYYFFTLPNRLRRDSSYPAVPIPGRTVFLTNTHQMTGASPHMIFMHIAVTT